MASLNLMIDNFQDPDPAAAKRKTTLSFFKSKFENQRTAYEYAKTTDYSDTKVFLILRDFLQPDTTKSLSTTVQSILDLLPENATHSSEVWCVGEVALELAQQIPYHHPSQIKLARVIGELSRSNKTTLVLQDTGMYICFPRFQESLADAYTGPGEEDPVAWPNFHAFLAHLGDCRLAPPSPRYAIYVMRDAFENDVKNEEGWFEGIQNQNVLAAAQHILWNGQNLLKQMRYPGDVSPSDTPAYKAGPLYDGKPMLSLDRWNFWREGFNASADDSTLSDECRSVARKVAGMMDTLEQSMMF